MAVFADLLNKLKTGLTTPRNVPGEQPRSIASTLNPLNSIGGFFKSLNPDPQTTGGTPISYGMSGATSLTPWGVLQPKPQMNQDQQNQYNAGRFLYGSALTAPASGGSALSKLLSIGKNVLIGGGFGGVATTAGTLWNERRLPTQQELTQGVRGGAENSWIYPATSALTNKALGAVGTVFPKVNWLTDKGLRAGGDLVKNAATEGLSKFFPQAGKQIVAGATREALETPLETAAFAQLDQSNGNTYGERYKNRFLNDLVSNAIVGGARTGLTTLPSFAKANAVTEAQAAKEMGMTPAMFRQRGAIDFSKGTFNGVNKEPLTLSPSKPEVTTSSLTDLKKLKKSGADLSSVTFVANKPNDIREALKILPSNQVQLYKTEVPSKGTVLVDESGTAIKTKIEEPTQQETASVFNTTLKDESKKVGGFKKALRSTLTSDAKREIATHGEVGQKIVGDIKQQEYEADVLSGTMNTKFDSAVKMLTKDEQKNFGNYVEGKAEIPNERVRAAVDLWKAQREQLYKMAVEAGLDPGYITDYFPHYAKEKLEPEQVVQKLVAKGIPLAEAQARVDRTLSRYGERKFGSIDYSREAPELDYRTDAGVIYDYIRGLSERITRTKYFGKDDSLVYDLAKQTNDKERIKELLDSEFGKGDTWGKKQKGEDLANTINSVQTVAKLGLPTSVLNLTQNLNTALKTDTVTTLTAIKDVLLNWNPSKERATSLGEVEPGTLKVLGEEYNSKSLVGKFISMIGMKKTEEFNRMVAVRAGDLYATKLAQQLEGGSQSALRELKRLGVDESMIVNGKLTQEGLNKAAKAVAQTTQFTKGDRPMMWKTPLGKVMSQFKTFAYNQTHLIKDTVLKRNFEELAAGNVKPLVNTLITYGVSAVIAGELVNDLGSILRNKERKDKNYLDRYINNLVSASSLGLLSEVSGLSGQYGLAGQIGSITGPTGSDLAKTLQAGGDTVKGLSDYDAEKSFIENVDPNNTTRRFLLGNIPIVGKTLSNTLVDNAAIDNKFGGVNEGLTKDNKDVFRALEQTNPELAQQFKNENQYLDTKDQEKTSFLDTIFGSKKEQSLTSSIPPKNAPPAIHTKFRSQIKKQVDLGLPIPPEVASYYYLDGETIADQANSKQKDAFYTKLASIMNNKDISDENKLSALSNSGVPASEFSYYLDASGNDDQKLVNALELVSKAGDDRNLLITSLIANKRLVGSKALVNNTITDYLYNKGLISKDEKAFINAIKFDEVFGEFYTDRDFVESGGGSGGLSKSKAISLMKQVYSMYDKPIMKSNKVSKSTPRVSTSKQTSVKITPIVPTRGSSKLWFKPY